MNITINTDASWHPQDKVGGYAFWIVCDLFIIKKSGRFKTKPRCSTTAELMCIGNAFATLLAQKELPQCRFLVINTDSKNGIHQIKYQTTKTGKEVFKLWNRLKSRLQPYKSEFRHVKAHSGKKDGRSFVNEWCDEQAKIMMRRWREEEKSKQLQ